MWAIGRRAFLVLSVGVVSSLLGFVCLFFMARCLGPEDYGVLSWSVAFVGVVSVVSDLGFNYAHIKRVSEGRDLRDCVTTFAFVKILLSFSMLGIGLVLLLALDKLGVFDVSGMALPIVTVFLVYQLLVGLSSIGRGTFDARLRTSKSQSVTLAESVIRSILIVSFLVAGMGLMQVGIAYVFGGAGALALSLILLSREGIGWSKPSLIKPYAMFAIPVMAATVGGILSVNVDKLLLGWFWESQDVAYFSASQSLLGPFSLIGAALSIITFPAFARYRAQGHIRLVVERIHLTEKYTSAVLFPVVLVLFAFPTMIATLVFGDDFREAGKTLGLLAVASLCYQLNQVACSYVLASDKAAVLAKLTWFHLAFYVILLVWLVPGNLALGLAPGLSYQGAAIANVVAMVTTFAITRIYLHRSLGVGIYTRLGYHVLSALATLLVLTIFANYAGLEGIWAVILYLGMSYAFFLGFLASMREFTAKDVRALVAIIEPRKMMEYLRSESKGGRDGQ